MDTMKPRLFDLDIQTIDEDEETIAEVTIDGLIGEDPFELEEDQNTKQRMREQLREIDDIEADRIVVNISSLGGDVDHGLAIHDLLASNDAEVETNVAGMTASAATIIAQAGDTRKMSDNALYLIHRAWTIGMGNANDFEVLAKDLNTLDDRISNIYAKRSEQTQDDFLELMNEANGDGIWLSAGEAEDKGLIDEVVEPMKAAASVPEEMFEKYNLPKPEHYKQKDNRQITIRLQVDGGGVSDQDPTIHSSPSFSGVSLDVIRDTVPQDISRETAPEDTEWSSPNLEDFTDQSWEDLSVDEKRRISQHFAWRPEGSLDEINFTDLKLPHHRPSDGAVVKNGVDAAVAALEGARGGVDIPEDEEDAVRAHLEDHQAQFDEEENMHESANATSRERLELELFKTKTIEP